MKTLISVVWLMLWSTMSIAATFDGYECTDDCSGHQAGYDWAEENDIDDEDSCDTPSQSFNEGCQSYVDGGSGVTLSDDEDDE
ncbi:hypothetical protein D3C76_290800 [compost metagenome]